MKSCLFHASNKSLILRQGILQLISGLGIFFLATNIAFAAPPAEAKSKPTKATTASKQTKTFKVPAKVAEKYPELAHEWTVEMPSQAELLFKRKKITKSKNTYQRVKIRKKKSPINRERKAK